MNALKRTTFTLNKRICAVIGLGLKVISVVQLN